MKVYWQWMRFDSMGTANLYKVIQLRSAIFIEEENYAYNDLDDRDQDALHLLGFEEREYNWDPKLVSYARVMLPQYNQNQLEIGRVVVAKEHRKKGIGVELLTRALHKIDVDYPHYSAHVTVAKDRYYEKLIPFYSQFNFKPAGASHNPHYTYRNFSLEFVEMERPAKFKRIDPQEVKQAAIANQPAASPQPTKTTIYWQWLTFDELGTKKLYQALQLRGSVIDQKNYAYNELDDRDQKALHLLGFESPDEKPTENDKLVAYARLMLPEFNHGKMEMGRVVVDENYRKKGLGNKLLDQFIEKVDKEFPDEELHITIGDDKHGQHLPKFYGRVGFKFKQGDARSNNPLYQYKNFEIRCFEMTRQPINKKHKKESYSTTLLTAGVAVVMVGFFAYRVLKGDTKASTSTFGCSLR